MIVGSNLVCGKNINFAVVLRIYFFAKQNNNQIDANIGNCPIIQRSREFT